MVLAQQRQFTEEVTQQEVQTRIVRKRIEVWKRPPVLVAFGAMALFAAGVLIASQYADVAVQGYEVQKLKGEVTRLQTSVAEMRHEVEGYKSLQRIEGIATEKLHMERPTQQVRISKVEIPVAPAQQQVAQAEVKKEQGKNPVVAMVTRFFGQ